MSPHQTSRLGVLLTELLLKIATVTADKDCVICISLSSYGGRASLSLQVSDDARHVSLDPLRCAALIALLYSLSEQVRIVDDRDNAITIDFAVEPQLVIVAHHSSSAKGTRRASVDRRRE